MFQTTDQGIFPACHVLLLVGGCTSELLTLDLSDLAAFVKPRAIFFIENLKRNWKNWRGKPLEMAVKLC